MALMDYLRPNYPQDITDKTGQRLVFVFRGPTTTLDSLRPGIGSGFGGGLVERVQISPLETSDYSEMQVESYIQYAQSSSEITDSQYPYVEIDEVQVEKPLRQHPTFIDFTAEEWSDIQNWENETDNNVRQAFQFYDRDKDGQAVGTVQTLTGTGGTTGCQAYATLRLLGVESFLDFSPVFRKTSRYIGNQAPSLADAGQKTSAPSGAPSGYEWLKTADRVSKNGTRSNEWLRQEEWTGARKVLVDKDDIFLT